MADGGNRTLVIAVAGIAATALVGLAGTTAAWLSARDDRDAQRALARDERTYDRRAAVYLDAIDFLEGQKESLDELLGPFAAVPVGTPLLANPAARERVPYAIRPSTRLTTRLRAFGSEKAFAAFQKTQAVNASPTPAFVADVLPFVSSGPGSDSGHLDAGWYVAQRPSKGLLRRYGEFKIKLAGFEDIVHDELGI